MGINSRRGPDSENFLLHGNGTATISTVYLVGHSHPSVWHLIRGLQQDSALVSTQISLTLLGNPPRKRTKQNSVTENMDHPKVKFISRILTFVFLSYTFITYLRTLGQNPQNLSEDQKNSDISISHSGNPELLTPGNYAATSNGSSLCYNMTDMQDLVHNNHFYLTPRWRHYMSRNLTTEVEILQPLLRYQETQLLYDLWRQLQSTCLSLDILCIMYGGTLLGSWRHHHLIPWDDDADAFVSISKKDILHRVLARLSPAYCVTEYRGKLKFYSNKSSQTSAFPWKWPFIDIWFYSENNTHIWDAVSIKNYKRDYTYPKCIVFPVHLRPFGRMLLYAPKDSFRFLQITYPKTADSCSAQSYNHKLDKTEEWRERSILCRSFEHSLGFVHRVRLGKHLVETLCQGSQKIHSLLINEPAYAVTDPFSLTLL